MPGVTSAKVKTPVPASSAPAGTEGMILNPISAATSPEMLKSKEPTFLQIT